MHTFKPGGIHPPQSKITAGKPIIDVELPYSVVVTFSQHIGASAVCQVKKGDHVNRGDVVARASGFVSANVHTPISGTVVKIDSAKSAYGLPAETVTIEASEEDHQSDLSTIASAQPVRTIEEALALPPQEIVSIIDAAGIVGLGGAAFPTKVKLTPPAGSVAQVLIINGAECEPYLTNDDALMRSNAIEIVEGILILMKAAKVDRTIVGIEDNKPEAIAAMRAAVAATKVADNVEIMPLKTKYPQGGEKQLIEATIGKEVQAGKLPISVGAVVQNVATAFAVYQAVIMGEPLMSRVITVTGPSVQHPGNYRVALGTNMRAIVELAGGFPADTGKIVLGGPMMGRAVVSIDAPTVKGVSGILMLPESESHRGKVQPCIRCAKCVEACPMGLEPYLLSTLSRLNEIQRAKSLGVMNCIECGSCSYVCPSWRPILDYIRLGKRSIKLTSQ
ncbi:MAG: electron transport complex subunit RsxC [Muribaculaceae bacterium]|nr:electron transport complex subunit RsxC [Muribaculaceae bacterium]